MQPSSPKRQPGPLHLLLALLLMASGLQLAGAQMASPLKGQGGPRPETRDVFLSCYLDRLLNVDDRNYRWEASFVFYVSWNDSQAHYAIANTSALVAAGQQACQRQCTDWADDISCCDDIYIPSFFFRNGYRFSQDRISGYKIYALAPPNGSLLWTQVVQGEFYQPMQLNHFPFDSFDLFFALEFLDTSSGTHPGLTVHPGSGGTQLYTLGLGDAVSDWHVESINITVANNVNSASLFKLTSSLPSHPLDPLPLSTGQAAALRATLPGASTTSRLAKVQLVFIKIRIARFWSYHVLTTVVPVALLGWISFVIFFLSRRDLSSRLGVTVTLFLALAAVQFVISSDQPASSYVLPTQQQIILTYCLLALMAIESILVYHIETWKESTECARQRRLARDRVLSMSRSSKAASAAADAAVAAADAAYAAKGAAAAAAQGQQAQQAQQGAPTSSPGGKEATCGSSSCSTEAAQEQPIPALPLVHPARIKSLQADMDYDAYVAHIVDRTALALLFLAYNIATVLIFTLQQGYINLFPGL